MLAGHFTGQFIALAGLLSFSAAAAFLMTTQKKPEKNRPFAGGKQDWYSKVTLLCFSMSSRQPAQGNAFDLEVRAFWRSIL
jgi:hypothetical protein